MDTAVAVNWLRLALDDLCDEFNRKAFLPLLEADVAAFVYHRLLLHGCPQSALYSETRICGISEKRKYDLVIGEISTHSGCINPLLVIQLKCFPRWGKTPQQMRMSFQETMDNDLPSLKTVAKTLAKGRFEVIADFFFTKQMAGYLSGKWNSRQRIAMLSERCQDNGVNLMWVRPNSNGNLEVNGRFYVG